MLGAITFTKEFGEELMCEKLQRAEDPYAAAVVRNSAVV